MPELETRPSLAWFIIGALLAMIVFVLVYAALALLGLVPA